MELCTLAVCMSQVRHIFHTSSSKRCSSIGRRLHEHFKSGVRMAHLYLLRHLNQIPAYLIFVYFVQAEDVKGPETMAEWKAALSIVKRVLGIGGHHRLSRFVLEVFIPVTELQGKA